MISNIYIYHLAALTSHSPHKTWVRILQRQFLFQNNFRWGIFEVMLKTSLVASMWQTPAVLLRSISVSAPLSAPWCRPLMQRCPDLLLLFYNHPNQYYNSKIMITYRDAYLLWSMITLLPLRWFSQSLQMRHSYSRDSPGSLVEDILPFPSVTSAEVRRAQTKSQQLVVQPCVGAWPCRLSPCELSKGSAMPRNSPPLPAL